MPETTAPTETDTRDAVAVQTPAGEPLAEESLVEEVSIDGMCGVY